MPRQPTPGRPRLPYRDDPSIAETFVDSFHSGAFDGVLRLEFTINRLDEPKPPKPPSGYAKTAARLVLTQDAAIALFNHLNQLMAALAAAGAVVQQPAAPAKPPN